ncbi:toll-like receptor Tollo [Aphidius gifuensis]|uniref:toll-like receptor Tollo n=1 Tax=Aphidius gifuensis TaxID=684658 RepID=UPI001CDB5C63|nr:toll-like receptor Tollo [Aphidius gifuensis]
MMEILSLKNILTQFSLYFMLLLLSLDNGNSGGVVDGRSITSLESPKGCQWGDNTKDNKEKLLICYLRTLSNANYIIGNISAIQADVVTSLKLECNDALFVESSFENSQDFLKSLNNLNELNIANCKMRYLSGGVFTSSHNIRNLRINTKNNDWSVGMSLEINRDSLRGLDNLRKLDLSDNNIWSLPNELLCPVQGLLSLNLTNNKLQDVVSLGFTTDSSSGVSAIGSTTGITSSSTTTTTSSSSCTSSLEVLDLSYNDLNELPDRAFINLKSLTTLNINNNEIRHVGDHALGGLGKLLKLNISTNRLVALPPELFSDTKQLHHLVLSNNSLSVLAPGLLDNLKNLQTLDLSNNELTSRWINRDTFTNLEQLVVLDLSNNALTKIDSNVFKGLYNLQILHLEYNNIDTLSDGCFLSLKNLHSLTLSHNRITRFDPNHTIGLVSLVQLFLDSNKLTNIHRHTFINVSSLQDFSLSGNELTTIPDTIRQLKLLKTLDLGNNKISSINNESFYGLNELYGLRLVDNKIENITRDTFTTLPALQVLNLASNSIRHIEQSAFSSNSVLRAIRLDCNELTDIRGAFSHLTTLVWLNISDNKLLWFDYSHLPASLEWLDMHNNQISELGNYYMNNDNINIKMLDASFNLISDITDSNIPDKIETLFLNNNKIRNVSPGTFMKKINIEKVVLYGNEIKHIDMTAFNIQQVSIDKALPEFYIGNNPIICDCTMEWLPKINELSRTRQYPRVMDLDSVMCDMIHIRATPKRPLLSLKSKDFLCNYETHCFALCHCCDFDACDCEMTCPDNCSCYHDHSWSSNVVDCSNGGYKNVPDRIPMDATEIYLDGNDLGDLGSHVFIGKRRLQILYLNNSAITALHNRTFNGAPSLRVLHLEDNSLRELRGFEFDQLDDLSELYLDHNAIAKVGNTTFNKMKNLEILRLDSNRIVDFRPWEAFIGTGVDAKITLEGNAWNCDCSNTEKLRLWLSKHNGDSGKMYCRDATETLAQALERCGDPTTEIISRGIISINSDGVAPLMGGNNGNFVPLLAGSLVAIIILCLMIALGFAFRKDIRLWAHSKYGLRLGKIASSLPDDERDRLYDGYIIYNERDQEFVAGCLSAELEQSGLSLCLHYRDLPPAHPQEALPSAAAAAKRIVIVFSPVFLANEWQHQEFRAALRCAMETIRPASRRRRVLILLAAEAPRHDTELQLLLQMCQVIVWDDKRFWEKLKFSMPDPADKKRCNNNNNNNNNNNSNRNDGKKLHDRYIGGIRIPARYTAAPSAPTPTITTSLSTTMTAQPIDLWSKPNGMLVAPVHHAPTPTPTQSTYVSSASSRTEDEDSGAEHQHLHGGYSALHTATGRPASLSSRGSHLYSTIPEPPLVPLASSQHHQQQQQKNNSVTTPPPPPPPSTLLPINPRTYFV